MACSPAVSRSWLSAFSMSENHVKFPFATSERCQHVMLSEVRGDRLNSRRWISGHYLHFSGTEFLDIVSI